MVRSRDSRLGKWGDAGLQECLYHPPSQPASQLSWDPDQPHCLLSDLCVCARACACIGGKLAYVCMHPPYLKTSGSGPIRSLEMVGISGLGPRSEMEGGSGGEIDRRR